MTKLTKEQKVIIQKIHNFVKKEANYWHDDIFSNHVLAVKDYSIKLAKYYNADLFVSIISAYLHDIYYIQTKNHSIHEIEGCKFARKYLLQYKIPKKQIDLITKCILHHRGSKKDKRTSLEEKIIACADAMDHINRILYFFYNSQGETFDNILILVKGKIERGWNKLELPYAKELMKDKYIATKEFFKYY